MELSIRAYAKHRNIIEGAVRKAIKTGRISKNKNGKINPKIADKQWQENTDPAQIKDNKEYVTEDLGISSSFSTSNPPIGSSYQQSRAVKEIYNAKLTKLQFEKESKKLVSVNEVKIAAFNMARITRDRILNIPDRVIPNLVNRSDIHEMKKILKDELIKALEEISTK
jgi:hypothetical protein